MENRIDIRDEPAKSIFLDAREIASPDARAAYLDRRCGDDDRLRGEVETLLRHHSRLGDYLEHPACDPGPTQDVSCRPRTEGPGTVIGPYKLMEQIGEGGMGVVYVAEQHVPVRRKVALKVIKPGMDTRQVIGRFEAERQALAMMDHPNIAKIFDGGITESGRPYFVMELVRGLPITEYCDGQRLSIRERLELFVLVCRAVQHAHQKGIIHRDLKPSNILVTLHDGVPVPKVIDFGVAKATGQNLTEKTVYTAFTQLVGTPLYMSPEQVELSGLDIDTRSDIYSLGVLLYELLTGTTPFDSEALKKAAFDEMRRIIREDEPPKPSTRLSTLGATLTTTSMKRSSDPRQLNRSVRGELDWIAMKALEKNRTRRYETANDFAADVMRYLTDQPVEACPPSARYRFHKFARRNKAVLTTAALVVAALFIGTAVSTWQALRATQAEVRAEGSATEAQRQTTEARKAQGEALQAKQESERQRSAVSQNLYYADMRLGLVDWNAGNIGRLSSKLFSHVPRVGGEDQRDWEWYYLLALCHQDERSLMHHVEEVKSVGWSPNGRYLASTDSDGLIAIYDATTWQVLRNWQGVNVWGGNWSPDSQRFAWTTLLPDNGLYVGQVATGETRPLLGCIYSGKAPAWSPDGKHLASRGYGGIRLWDPATGSSIGVLDGNFWSMEPMAWDPDGKLLVLADGDKQLKTWDAVSGQGSRAVPSMTGMNSAAWSPDGKRLALGMNTGKCLVYKTTDWSVAGEWDAHTGPVRSVVWHPDGSQLASAGADHLIQVWDPATGHNLRTLRGHLNQVITLAWEPNGRRLVSGGLDGLVKVWPLAPALQPRRLEGHAGGVRAIAWSEDGETLRSFGSADGTIALWNVVAGQPLSKVPVRKGASAQFSAQGRLLAIATTDEKKPEILIHDARSGERIQTVKKATVVAAFSAFSPDSSKLALSNGRTVQIVDLGPDEVRFRWESQGYSALSWSPDGRLLAAAGLGEPERVGGTVEVWKAWIHVFDVKKRQRLVKLLHGSSWGAATAVAWNPNGQRLVSGDVNGLVEVWQVATGHKVASAHLHTAAVKALAWSPNGQRVASGSGDGAVAVWDPIRGEELMKLNAPKSDVTHLEWSPNGRRLAAATADGAILIWDATSGYDFVHGEVYASERVEHSLNQATQLRRAGRKNEAFALYEQTLEQNKPKLGAFPRWVAMSIRSYAELASITGQDHEAIELYQLLAQYSNDGRLQMDLGAAFRRRGQSDEAIACFREAINLTYNSELAYNEMGNVFAIKGQTDEAIAAYREAIRLRSDFYEAHSNFFKLCKELTAKGQLDEASAYFQEAIRLSKDEARLLSEHANLGWYDEVGPRESIRLNNKGDWMAHHRLGNTLFEKGRADEAITSYREAITSYREAIRLNKDDGRAHEHLAWLLATVSDRRFRDIPQALQLARQAVKLGPSEGDFWRTLGVCLYRAGDWKAAIEALEKSSQLRNGGDGFDWFFLAMAHWQLGDQKKARTWYLQALEWMTKKPPTNAELRRFRAEATELLGVKDKSKADKEPPTKPDEG